MTRVWCVRVCVSYLQVGVAQVGEQNAVALSVVMHDA